MFGVLHLDEKSYSPVNFSFDKVHGAFILAIESIFDESLHA